MMKDAASSHRQAFQGKLPVWPLRGRLLPWVLSMVIGLALAGCQATSATSSAELEPASPPLPRVKVSDDSRGFILADTGQPFTPWGFNYVGGVKGQCSEEDWHTPEGWDRVDLHLGRMKQLGANAVRWHLQFETYMLSPTQADEAQLARLKALLALARHHGLYLNLTGLNCFRKDRIPAWYDALPEAERWAAQAEFWRAIARTCAGDTTVLCYNLMNEPVITKPKEGEHPWVTGELGGMHFVQRISHNRDSRPQREVAADWVRLMVQAIREHDRDTLTTVGVIPWAFVWPNARPNFYTELTADYLDYVSIHVYPKSGQLEKEIKALGVYYDVGKPVVIDEIFTLACTFEELDQFMNAADGKVQGWFAHFFGPTIQEHRQEETIQGAVIAHFLEFWQRKAGQVPWTQLPDTTQ